MTDGVSRRNLVFTGGAAAALTSCTPGPSRMSALNVPTRRAGFDDNHGSDPMGPPTYPGPVVYLPRFIAIAIIDFDKPWTIDVHHASFPLPPDSAGDRDRRRDLAKKAISWVVESNGRKLGHLNAKPSGYEDLVPYERKKDPHKGKHHIASFDGFRFASQNEIFIFLRNPDIVLNRSRLVRVTRYSDEIEDVMTCNYSLFRAESIEGDDLGPLENHGKLIRVENHVRDEKGLPSGKDTNYSMNIHFRMKVKPEGGERSYVPMVIDPDTGNGQGNEP